MAIISSRNRFKWAPGFLSRVCRTDLASRSPFVAASARRFRLAISSDLLKGYFQAESGRSFIDAVSSGISNVYCLHERAIANGVGGSSSGGIVEAGARMMGCV